MNAYTLTVTLHVIIAVLGLGQVAALTVVARKESATSDGDARAFATIGKLTTRVTSSLVALLVTGVAIEWLSGGLYHDTWWFRISFLLFVLVGAGAGRIRGVLRRASSDAAKAMSQIRLASGLMSGLVAVIAALMVLMP